MRAIVLGAAAIAALGSAGCMTVGSFGGRTLGPAGYVYQGGRATRTFAVATDKVQEAALEALADMGVHSVKQIFEPGRVILDGRTADGRRATLTIDAPPNAIPTVTARIGWFGDEPLSRALLDRLAIRLDVLPPDAVPVNPPSEPATHTFLRGATVPGSGGEMRSQADMGYRDSPIP